MLAPLQVPGTFIIPLNYQDQAKKTINGVPFELREFLLQCNSLKVVDGYTRAPRFTEQQLKVIWSLALFFPQTVDKTKLIEAV